MILAIGSLGDPTFAYTVKRLRQIGCRLSVVDIACLILNGEMWLDAYSLSNSYFEIAETRISLADISSIYVRLVDISSGAPSSHIRNRFLSAYYALLEFFTYVPLPIINPPLAESSNFTKMFHGTLLSQLGFKVPESCLTNSVDDLSQFSRTCKTGIIYKGASSTKTWVSEYKADQDWGRLQFLERSSPVLFQRRIVGPDIRVHVVGDYVSAEYITSLGIDYRADKNNTYKRVEIPQELGDACVSLCETFGQPMMGIDFKREEDTGTYFILEANSLPAYQGYDRRAKGAISNAIATYLTSCSRCG